MKLRIMAFAVPVLLAACSESTHTPTQPEQVVTLVHSRAAVTASDFAQGPNAAFAANTISPNATSCTVGSNCSVDVGMWVGGGAYGGTYGIDFKVYFDPTVLQAVSVTTAAGSPYPNSPAIGDGHTSPANSIDNVGGVVFYSAMSAPGAGFNGGSPFAVATIVFKAISAGSSVLQLRPDQWLNAYGPFGNGGLATYGNVTVTGATQTPSTTTVSFGGGPFPYTGSAYVATATVSPAGSASIAYSGDCINAGGTCTATATYAGDATHTGSSATSSITITKAPSITTVSFGPGPFVYTGTAFTATANVLLGGPGNPAGPGGGPAGPPPTATATISYAGDCVNGGTSCTATATYGGDPNHTGSSATASITIVYNVCTASGDDRNEDGKGSKGIEAGSTLPVSVRVCNAAGRSIGSRSLTVKAVGVSPTGSLNDSGKANPGNLFRLDDGSYMYNLSTKGLTAGNYTLDFTIGNDPTVYHYAFTIRAKSDKNSEKDGDK